MTFLDNARLAETRRRGRLFFITVHKDVAYLIDKLTMEYFKRAGVVHFRTTVTLTITPTLRILMWRENGPVLGSPTS